MSSSGNKKRRRAQAISSKINKMFPYATYGRAYIQRGTPYSLGRYGRTFKDASDVQRLNRKEDGYVGKGRYKRGLVRTGKGFYPGFLSDAGSFVGAGLGHVLGGSAAAGANYGSRIGRWVSEKTGWGSYKNNGYIDQGIPQVRNTKGTDGAVIVQHTEYLGEVRSTGTNFNLGYKLEINPGLSKTFPWLSQIAKNFTQYTINGMLFNYRTTSGALSTAQALGEIIMATNYNTADADFTSKQQMLGEVMARSIVPSVNAEHGIECDPKQTAQELMYIRTDHEFDQPDSKHDRRFYDIGTFYLATQGQSAAATLGELWVTYEIALYKPSLDNTEQPIGCQILVRPSKGIVNFDGSGATSTTAVISNGHQLGRTLSGVDTTYLYNTLKASIGASSWFGGANDSIFIPITAPDGYYLLTALYSHPEVATSFTAGANALAWNPQPSYNGASITTGCTLVKMFSEGFESTYRIGTNDESYGFGTVAPIPFANSQQCWLQCVIKLNKAEMMALGANPLTGNYEIYMSSGSFPLSTTACAVPPFIHVSIVEYFDPTVQAA